MRFFWSFFWAFLISSVLAYVLSSMAGNTFDLTGTFMVAIAISITVFILGEGVLKGESEQ